MMGNQHGGRMGTEIMRNGVGEMLPAITLRGEASGGGRLERMPSMVDLRRFSSSVENETAVIPSHLIPSRPASVFTAEDPMDMTRLPPPPSRSNSIVRAKSQTRKTTRATAGQAKVNELTGAGQKRSSLLQGGRKRYGPRSPSMTGSINAAYKSYPSPRDHRCSSQLLPTPSIRSLYPPPDSVPAIPPPSSYQQPGQATRVRSSSSSDGIPGPNAATGHRRMRSNGRRPPHLKLAKAAVTPRLWMDDENVSVSNPLSASTTQPRERNKDQSLAVSDVRYGGNRSAELVSAFSPVSLNSAYDGMAIGGNTYSGGIVILDGPGMDMVADERQGKEEHGRRRSDEEDGLAYRQPDAKGDGTVQGLTRGPIPRHLSLGPTPSLPPLDSAASSSFKADWEAAVRDTPLPTVPSIYKYRP